MGTAQAVLQPQSVASTAGEKEVSEVMGSLKTLDPLQSQAGNMAA
jgi:hypothetical protein